MALRSLVLSTAIIQASAFSPGRPVQGRALGQRARVARQPNRRLGVSMPSFAIQSAATPKSGAEGLCKKLSSTLASSLGKPESYVLVTFQKVDGMCFGGSTDPAAFCYLSSLGSITPEKNTATSAAVAAVLAEELDVPQNRYYINFFDSERSNMGYNGGTF